MHFINQFSADEVYSTPVDDVGAGPTFESVKRLVVGKRRLVYLYAWNSSAAACFLTVQDTAGAISALATVKHILPIPVNSYINLVIQGGERYELGILLAAYTDKTLATPAGAIMFYRAGWTGYH